MTVNVTDGDLSLALKLLAQAHERELSQLQSFALHSHLEMSSPYSFDCSGCGPSTKVRRGAIVAVDSEPASRNKSSDCSADKEPRTDTRTNAIVLADSETVNRNYSRTGSIASTSPSSLVGRGCRVEARRNAVVSADNEAESCYGPQPVSIASTLVSRMEVLAKMVRCRAAWVERCRSSKAFSSMNECTDAFFTARDELETMPAEAKLNASVSVDSKAERRHKPHSASVVSTSFKEIFARMVQSKASWADRCSYFGAHVSMAKSTEELFSARGTMEGEFVDLAVEDRDTQLSVSTQAPSSGRSSGALDSDFLVPSFSINTSVDAWIESLTY